VSNPVPASLEFAFCGQSADRSSAVDDLARRSVCLAALVEASSRRRDVRDLRARLTLLLLALRCPLSGRPGRPWYIPGAVVRLGAEGLARAWRGYWGEAPPCLRSLRAHLGCLEGAGVLQRAPGEWLPRRRDEAHPERRPRWPDTFHVLDGETATEWWAGHGARLLELYPAARQNPDVWRRLFAGWRRPGAAAQGVLALAGGAVSPRRVAASPDEQSAVRARGVMLARALKRAAGAAAVLEALEVAGAGLRGGASFRGAGAWPRLRSAGAMLARALQRGDRVRNPAGWVWRAFQSAAADELAAARRWIGDDVGGVG
jgi:hypothetical protein